MIKYRFSDSGTFVGHNAHDWRGTNPKDLKCFNCGITSWNAKWDGRKCINQWSTTSGGWVTPFSEHKIIDRSYYAR